MEKAKENFKNGKGGIIYRIFKCVINRCERRIIKRGVEEREREGRMRWNSLRFEILTWRYLEEVKNNMDVSPFNLYIYILVTNLCDAQENLYIYIYQLFNFV